MAKKSKNHDGTYSTESTGDDFFVYWHNEQDQLHREDGPAAFGPYGGCQWWFRGENLSGADKLEERVEAARKEFFERSMAQTTTPVNPLPRIRLKNNI